MVEALPKAGLTVGGGERRVPQLWRQVSEAVRDTWLGHWWLAGLCERDAKRFRNLSETFSLRFLPPQNVWFSELVSHRNDPKPFVHTRRFKRARARARAREGRGRTR